jgi:hypothetical protein
MLARLRPVGKPTRLPMLARTALRIWGEWRRLALPVQRGWLARRFLVSRRTIEESRRSAPSIALR